MRSPSAACLLIACPDKPGIVAAVTSFLYQHNVNVTVMDQYSTAPSGGRFFLRLEFETPDLDVSRTNLEAAFAHVVAERFSMTWQFTYRSERKKMAVLVSKHDHALMEILWRWQRGELHADLTMVISNHNAAREAVANFGVPFHHVPVTKDTKPQSEARILELLADQADLVVLARYMQILSPEFVARFPSRIINIHHSFLPAFVGANPYRRAHERGVKIIGATAHYVTPDLDAGPIIEQDVARVSHRDTVADLKERGATLERQVLAQAVRWHLDDRVLVNDNRTVVFA